MCAARKLCFDISVFVCQPNSLKTVQLQQTLRSGALLNLSATDLAFIRSVCLSLNQSLKPIIWWVKRRLRVFGWKCSGWVQSGHWQPVPVQYQYQSIRVPVQYQYQYEKQSTRVPEWDSGTLPPGGRNPIASRPSPYLPVLHCSCCLKFSHVLGDFSFNFFFIFSHNITSPSQIPFLSCQDSWLCSCYLLRCFEKKNLHLLEYTS